MSECDISDIYPRMYAGRGHYRVADLALHERQYSLVGCVQLIQAGEVVRNGTEDQRRVQ